MEEEIDPRTEEEIYAEFRQMVVEGLAEEYIDENGEKVWRLTAAGWTAQENATVEIEVSDEVKKCIDEHREGDETDCEVVERLLQKKKD